MSNSVDRVEPVEHGRFDNLGSAAALIGAVVARPGRFVFAVTTLLIIGAWLFLTFMALGALRAGAEIGPAADWLRTFGIIEPPGLIVQFLDLCLTPLAVDALPISVTRADAFLALYVMWLAMAFAMMLPSAAPLIRTYVEIADTAAAKSEYVVHPVVLVAGYLLIWATASLGFTIAHFGFWNATGSAVEPLTGPIAGLVLIAAGIWQFTPIKDACLTKCRNPFSLLFSNWRSTRSGVFKLGLEQGLYCLGCCWALMLIMFAVGTMNIVWMAFLALFTLIEKTGKGVMTTRVSGSILVLWGCVLLGHSTI